MLRLSTLSFMLFSAVSVYAANSSAEDAVKDSYVITLKDHAFSPAELIVPAGQKIHLIVKNLQSSPAEFESSDLEREKVVGANSEIKVLVGPLDAGKYSYVDDFHHDTKAVIIAK